MLSSGAAQDFMQVDGDVQYISARDDAYFFHLYNKLHDRNSILHCYAISWVAVPGI